MGRTLAVAMAASLFAGGALARDLAAMKPEEIRILQQRLTEAKCYSGQIDGRATPEAEMARRRCPDQEPILTIETGMHTASIEKITVDENCKVALTASEDKTARIWSLQDGTLNQVIRVPISRDGLEGRLNAAALSPDGRYIAIGGVTSNKIGFGAKSVILIDRTSLTRRTIGYFDGDILKIEFSPDSQRIAVALSGNAGVRILDVSSERELMADRDYGWSTYGLAYSADGNVYSSGIDGYIRRYDSKFKRTGLVKVPENLRPVSVATQSGGTYIAVGSSNTSDILIFDTKSMKVAKRYKPKNMDGSVGYLSYAPDGVLWGGGDADALFGKQNQTYIRRFDSNGQQVRGDLPIGRNTINSIAFCGGNAYIATAEPSITKVTRDDDILMLQRPVAIDVRSWRESEFSISSSGDIIRYTYQRDDTARLEFNLTNGSLSDATSSSINLSRPKTDGLDVTDWQNRVHPKLNGKEIKIGPYGVSRSLAVRSDLSGFALGSEWALHTVDNTGNERWRVSISSVVWNVNLAQNGNLIIAALGDGTIRWYRWSDGKELLALFVQRLDKRWVAWTPTGYYMASPGGEDLIGWHVNRGWEQAPDFFPASRFRDRFARPDIVQKILQTLDEDEAVRQANQEAGKKDNARPIEAQLPPVVQITGPKDGTSVAGDTVTLDYTLRSPSGLPVDAIDVLIDGRPLQPTRGAGRTDEAAQAACPGLVNRGAGRTTAAPGEVACRITVPVPARAVEVALIARSGPIASVPALVRLVAGSGTAAKPTRGRLIALAIGISDYADPALKLGLAAKDAADFAETLSAEKGRLYSSVEVKSLVDGNASRAHILEGLDWLEKQRPTAEDVAVVFMAGHGETDEKGLFWFLPADVERASLRATAVSQDDLKRTLQGLPSKAVLFLDACHSGAAAGAVSTVRRGAVDMNAVVNEFSTTEGGVVTFASSMGREVSQENSAWGNGAFTKAVIEGIRDGKADTYKNNPIMLTELNAFIANRVAELTGERQHAVMVLPPTIADFALASGR